MYPATPDTSGTSASRVGPRQATCPPGQHETKEVDLLAGLEVRDKTAFREIVERHASKIYNVCFGILGNRDDAEEIAQEVFTKGHFSIHRFNGRSSLYAWICRIAVNECYGFLRTKRLKLAHSDDSLGSMLERSLDYCRESDASASGSEPNRDSDGAVGSIHTNCENALTQRMEAVKGERPTPDPNVLQRSFINQLLIQIPEDDRWLLASKEVEGFSLAELSQMSGRSEKAIRSSLFQARQNLLAAAARALRCFFPREASRKS